MGELSHLVPDFAQVVRITLRLLAALTVGTAIGLQRELTHKTAGLRTHMLVALGTALFVVGAAESGASMESLGRVIQGIAAGIGFLGGGVILRDDSHQSVHGLTTAASIWVVASLGIACGAGQWLTAVMALTLTLGVLILLGRVEKRCVGWFTRGQVFPVPPGPAVPPPPSTGGRPPGLA